MSDHKPNDNLQRDPKIVCLPQQNSSSEDFATESEDSDYDLSKDIHGIILQYLEVSGLDVSYRTFYDECQSMGMPLPSNWPAEPNISPNGITQEDVDNLFQCFDQDDGEGLLQLWDKVLGALAGTRSVETVKMSVYVHIYVALIPFRRQLSEAEKAIAMQTLRDYLESTGRLCTNDREMLSLFALPFIADPSRHPIFSRLFTDYWIDELRTNIESVCMTLVSKKRNMKPIDSDVVQLFLSWSQSAQHYFTTENEATFTLQTTCYPVKLTSGATFNPNVSNQDQTLQLFLTNISELTKQNKALLQDEIQAETEHSKLLNICATLVGFLAEACQGKNVDMVLLKSSIAEAFPYLSNRNKDASSHHRRDELSGKARAIKGHFLVNPALLSKETETKKCLSNGISSGRKQTDVAYPLTNESSSSSTSVEPRKNTGQKSRNNDNTTVSTSQNRETQMNTKNNNIKRLSNNKPQPHDTDEVSDNYSFFDHCKPHEPSKDQVQNQADIRACIKNKASSSCKNNSKMSMTQSINACPSSSYSTGSHDRDRDAYNVESDVPSDYYEDACMEVQDSCPNSQYNNEYNQGTDQEDERCYNDVPSQKTFLNEDHSAPCQTVQDISKSNLSYPNCGDVVGNNRIIGDGFNHPNVGKETYRVRYIDTTPRSEGDRVGTISKNSPRTAKQTSSYIVVRNSRNQLPVVQDASKNKSASQRTPLPNSPLVTNDRSNASGRGRIPIIQNQNPKCSHPELRPPKKFQNHEDCSPPGLRHGVIPVVDDGIDEIISSTKHTSYRETITEPETDYDVNTPTTPIRSRSATGVRKRL